MSGGHLREAYLDRAVADLTSGRGYFSGKAERELTAAVVPGDRDPDRGPAHRCHAPPDLWSILHVQIVH